MTVSALHINKKLMPFIDNSFFGYLLACGTVLICTLINFALYRYVNVSNLIMIYLLGVVAVATLKSDQYGPAMVTALLSALLFDFFFTYPRFSLSISHSSDIITLFVMFLVAQLISHLHNLARKNIEAIKLAQMQTEKERYRNLLLSSISHDLRTPLAAIMGSASILLHSNEKLTPTLRQELAQAICDESERLNGLVTNVLQIIRLEAIQGEISKERLPLDDIIGSALNAQEKLLRDRQLHLQLLKPSPLISVDLILIEKVFINLIENAVKFSPPNSPISISARKDNHFVEIKISDRGMGIDEKDLTLIFDKFYQGKKAVNSGIGLGLAICKDIIKAHGGKIWASNNQGEGAEFCFTLPLGY